MVSIANPFIRSGNVVMLWGGSANYDVVKLPIDTPYTRFSWSSAPPNLVPLIGDLVNITSGGKAYRLFITHNSGSDTSRLPFGVVVGSTINPVGYSAFAAPEPYLLVATVGVGTELLAYRINPTGVYLEPEHTTDTWSRIRVGDLVRLYFYTENGRWGVFKPPTGFGSTTLHAEVIDIVEEPPPLVGNFLPANDRRVDTIKPLHVRLIQPTTETF